MQAGRFIHIAEECGWIDSIGSWVLNETCRQLAEWRNMGLPSIPIAINVSAAQFARGNFAVDVVRALERYDLDPGLLELELTESLLMEDVRQSHEQLATLHKTGVRIVMDDFGTGYSSLSYLDTLPIDAIKIDRSFIDKINGSEPCAVLKSMVELGRRLGLIVVAEGVSTEEQRRLLARLDCDRLQGFLLARPQAGADIPALLRSRGCRSAANSIPKSGPDRPLKPRGHEERTPEAVIQPLPVFPS
jgi:EAL domain-containing protein (putative c-di-GMP-specific phosphodiesterase class I)